MMTCRVTEKASKGVLPALVAPVRSLQR